MSNVPSDLRYNKSHEWLKDLGNGIVEIGISDHAQELLGDLVYVELPELGSQAVQGKECAVVESVKAASDIYSPVTGEIIAVNEKLGDNPELVNQSPYQDGWLFRIRCADVSELDHLLTADGYRLTLD